MMNKKPEKKETMTILEFCKGYRNCTETVKPDYITEHLEIKQYLPILQKDVLVQRLVNATVHKYEGEGEERVRTTRININSVAQRVQFARLIIEAYTNLTATTSAFADEYDALKQSGLYDLLLVNYEDRQSLIPAWEIAECSDLVDLKIRDAMTNSYEIHGFIEEQVERFGRLANIAISPMIKSLQDKIDSMSKEDLDNVIDFVKKARNGEYMEVEDEDNIEDEK